MCCLSEPEKGVEKSTPLYFLRLFCTIQVCLNRLRPAFTVNGVTGSITYDNVGNPLNDGNFVFSCCEKLCFPLKYLLECGNISGDIEIMAMIGGCSFTGGTVGRSDKTR